MSYCVYVIAYRIIASDPEEASKILKEHKEGKLFYVKEVDGDTYIVPESQWFEWPDELYSLFLALSRVAEGHIMFVGEDGEVWAIELGKGRITEFEGEIVYEDGISVSLPLSEEEIEDPAVVNERYIAAGVWDEILVYDKKKREWFSFEYPYSLESIKLLEDICNCKDVDLTCCRQLNLQNLRQELSKKMEIFLEKIGKKDPEAVQEIKEALLAKLS